MTDRYDVVFAKSRSHIIDSLGNACRYRTGNGKALAPGYYTVTWHEAADPLFDENAKYVGPFPSARAAEAAIEAVLANGEEILPLLTRDRVSGSTT